MTELDQAVVQQIPRLRRYARALTGERGAADDLVQDTLERALSRMHLWRAGSDLRAWLFSIMHNVFVNQVRARNVRREDPLDEDAPRMMVRAEQSDLLEVRDLDRALQALTTEQREVLLLVALEQMSYEQAASALDIPVGTVMSRLSRGRERLRQALSGTAGVAGLKVVR